MPGFWVILKSNQMMRYIFTRTAVALSSSHIHTHQKNPTRDVTESEKSWIPRRTIRISQNFTDFKYEMPRQNIPPFMLWNIHIIWIWILHKELELAKKYCHLIYQLSMLRDNENKYTASKYMLRDSEWGLKGDIVTSSWEVPYLAGFCRKAVCNTRWTAED